MNIEIKKKSQRITAARKRLILNSSIKLNEVFFEKELIKKKWFTESNIIASFLSIKSEISTKSINNLIQKLGIKLCLPVMLNNKNYPLIFKKYCNGDLLIERKYGVKEPADKEILLPDIIITPCLAFDNLGYRLGYGGGFYDKTFAYLNSINHRYISIGYAFEGQKVDRVFVNQMDQKLHYILTEKHLYKV